MTKDDIITLSRLQLELVLRFEASEHEAGEGLARERAEHAAACKKLLRLLMDDQDADDARRLAEFESARKERRAAFWREYDALLERWAASEEKP